LGPWGLPGTPVRRGFYINPSVRDPGNRVPGAPEGPGRPPGAPRSPGRGLGPCQGPGPRSPGSRTPRRGGFYINPSRRGPAVPGGPRGPGSREDLRGPKTPISPKSGKMTPKPPFWGFPGDPPEKAFFGTAGRGWESAPPRRGGTPPEEGAGGLPLGRRRSRPGRHRAAAAAILCP